MAGPRKLWKTTIVVWSEWDPRNVETINLVREATNGDAYISREEHELISNPYKQPDGPPDGFFE
jgi:hypothetical protein